MCTSVHFFLSHRYSIFVHCTFFSPLSSLIYLFVCFLFFFIFNRKKFSFFNNLFSKKYTRKSSHVKKSIFQSSKRYKDHLRYTRTKCFFLFGYNKKRWDENLVYPVFFLFKFTSEGNTSLLLWKGNSLCIIGMSEVPKHFFLYTTFFFHYIFCWEIRGTYYRHYWQHWNNKLYILNCTSS